MSNQVDKISLIRAERTKRMSFISDIIERINRERKPKSLPCPSCGALGVHIIKLKYNAKEAYCFSCTHCGMISGEYDSINDLLGLYGKARI